MDACKNCNTSITLQNNFCNHCGAKIVKERITLKNLFFSLLDALGWESNIFRTFRYLFYQPHILLKEYINGTRKKYTNPFSFLVINLTISLFIYSQYSEELIQLKLPDPQEDVKVEKSINKTKGRTFFGYNSSQEFAVGISKTITNFEMKYYNLVSFFIIPFYTIIAFLVFRENNFGEHLIINTYLNGLLTFIALILFVSSLLIGVNVFKYTIFIMFFYYSYTYKKLHQLTFKKLLIKIIKFLGLVLLMFLAEILLVVVSMIIKNK